MNTSTDPHNPSENLGNFRFPSPDALPSVKLPVDAHLSAQRAALHDTLFGDRVLLPESLLTLRKLSPTLAGLTALYLIETTGQSGDVTASDALLIARDTFSRSTPEVARSMVGHYRSPRESERGVPIAPSLTERMLQECFSHVVEAPRDYSGIDFITQVAELCSAAEMLWDECGRTSAHPQATKFLQEIRQWAEIVCDLAVPAPLHMPPQKDEHECHMPHVQRPFLLAALSAGPTPSESEIQPRSYQNKAFMKLDAVACAESLGRIAKALDSLPQTDIDARSLSHPQKQIDLHTSTLVAQGGLACGPTGILEALLCARSKAQLPDLFRSR